jgi:hypothetical protein
MAVRRAINEIERLDRKLTRSLTGHASQHRQ